MIEYIEKEIILNGVKLIVSSDGKHIRTVDRYVTDSNGKRTRLFKGKELKQHLDKQGYYYVASHPKLNHIAVQRLVAIAFKENDDPEHKTDVGHIDNNPQNNHADNLEWVTKKENTQWMIKCGRDKNQYGGSKPVKCIDTGEVFRSASAAARRFGIKQAGVTQCCQHGWKCHGLTFNYI